jgi:hypothetical protein
LIDDLGRDLSYAFRQLRRSPGFALLAILCLGLGIGANTSIFGALNAALLRPLPVSDPDRVMMITRGQSANFSYPEFQDLQARTRLLSGVVAANYGSVLGITPALGQWFTSETEPMAVISGLAAMFQNRARRLVMVFGRLRPGTTPMQVSAELNGIDAQLVTEHGAPRETLPPMAAALVRGDSESRQPAARQLGRDAADDDGEPRAAHRLRQRWQPAARARIAPSARVRRPARAWRNEVTPAAAAAD